MKNKIKEVFWSKFGQAIFYFVLGVLVALLFTKTVFSPNDENVQLNVPADPVSESKGF